MAAADKKLGAPVLVVKDMFKDYELESKEKVHALRNINLNDSSPFPSIKKGEFVMIRGLPLCFAHQNCFFKAFLSPDPARKQGQVEEAKRRC